MSVLRANSFQDLAHTMKSTVAHPFSASIPVLERWLVVLYSTALNADLQFIPHIDTSVFLEGCHARTALLQENSFRCRYRAINLPRCPYLHAVEQFSERNSAVYAFLFSRSCAGPSAVSPLRLSGKGKQQPRSSLLHPRHSTPCRSSFARQASPCKRRPPWRRGASSLHRMCTEGGRSQPEGSWSLFLKRVRRLSLFPDRLHGDSSRCILAPIKVTRSSVWWC